MATQHLPSWHPSPVYVFGDQTCDVSSKFSSLIHISAREPLLKAFFDNAYRGLCGELKQVPTAERASFPRISSIRDLVALSSQQRLPPAFHPVVTCVYQLGCIIRACLETGRPYSPPASVTLVGLCTGSIAAAAVASSQNVSELITAGVQAARVAFRLGLCVARVSRAVEASSEDASRSWTIIVSGIPLSEAEATLKDFSSQRSLPIVSQPYISAIGESSISVSGPPSILSKLKDTAFQSLRVRDCSTSAPFHSSVLFTKNDIQHILASTSAETQLRTVHLSLLSSFSGRLCQSRTYEALLDEVLEDILLRPIVWDNVVHGVAHVTSFGRRQELKLIPAGANNYIAALYTALRNKGVNAVCTKGCSETEKREEADTPNSRTDDFTTPSGKSKIAIVGMSGRFPNAKNVSEYWDIIFKGLDTHEVVPSSRWSLAHVDAEGKRKNTSRTPYGCWLKEPGLFDASFFGISPREASQMDPASRLALMTTYEAMEQAGMVPDGSPSTTRDRVGVFYGVTSNDWMEVNSAQNIDTYFIPGGCRAFIPGRINYSFRFTGPSLAVDTACSSSMTALHTACNALWQGDIDTAISGGTNVLTNPDYTAGLDKGHFLSRTGNCKTFDETADGYCRGEGVCTFILKRLEDAVAENDPILGVIAGAHTNHSAEAESITRPHSDIQKAAFRTLMTDTGLNPHDIGYVEMHGTGTQAGDVAEIRSVVDAFTPVSNSKNSRGLHDSSRPLYIGSVKSNIGHGEAASGVSSVAKALLMLQHDTIPAHCGIKTKVNSKFPNLEEHNVHITPKSIAWPKDTQKARRICVNNFSAAGGNSAVLIEDAPLRLPASTDPRESHIVTLSARSTSALKRNAESLLSFLARPPTTDATLSSIEYSTTVRRMHHSHRLAVCASTLDELESGLREEISQYKPEKITKRRRPVTFAFTGNGTGFPGMAKHYSENFPSFRESLVRLDNLIQAQGFPSIVPFCCGPAQNDTKYPDYVIQLAVVCYEIALARLWISWGVSPDSVIGHSLGEYAALNVAGVLSDADTIYIVGKRAQLLQEKCIAGTHSMLSISAPREQISSFVQSSRCELACINGHDDIVVSGESSAIGDLHATLRSMKIKATVLPMQYAFHSSQVDVILEDFKHACRGLTFHKPKLPVLSPLKGTTVDVDGIVNIQYLLDHCRQKVDIFGAFCNARDSAAMKNNSIVLELGPLPIFTPMVRAAFGPSVMTVPSIRRNQAMWPALTRSLATLYTAGIDIAWKEYYRGFEACAKVISLPAYNWDLKNHWIQYVNDWSLRKGEPALMNAGAELSPTRASLPTLVESARQNHTWNSSIYKMVKENVDSRGGDIILEAGLSNSGIAAIITGHKVNGIPLATPAIYADAALTLGDYLLKRYFPQLDAASFLVEIVDLVIEKALISGSDAAGRLLRTSAAVKLSEKAAYVEFSTTSPKNNSPIRHSHCNIRLTPKAQALDDVRNQVTQANQCIQSLSASLSTGGSYRFNTRMIYRMVSSLAEFSEEYKCVKEIVMKSENLEASSVVQFAGKSEGFHCHPAFIDALSQSAGFIMNANDNSDLTTRVCVNHGWKGFKLFRSLDPNHKYATYLRLKETAAKTWEGDLVVLESGDIAAIFNGVTLHEVPTRALQMVLANDQRLQTSGGQRVQKVSALPPPPRPKQADERILHVEAEDTNNSTFHGVMRIISDETGIPENEITDDCDFVSMGIDSLMTLSLAARIREESSVSIDSSTLAEFTTIRDLRCFLEPTIGSGTVPRDDSQDHIPMPPAIVQLTVPSEDIIAAQDIEKKAMQVLSEETGVPISELTEEAELSSLGVDSLLSLILVSRLNEEFNLNLTGEAASSSGLSTVSSLKTYICQQVAPPKLEATTLERAAPMTVAPIASTHAASSSISTSSDQFGSSEATSVTSYGSDRGSKSPTFYTGSTERPSTSKPVPATSSVILQGRPRQSEKTLFLFPDGSGSAASYSKLPAINPAIATIALNSPYYDTPDEMACDFDDLVDSYLAEIQRRQPFGPYTLGGWSSGGILAYRATQRLIQMGEHVEALLLIDSPSPVRGLDRLPQRWYHQLSNSGMFGQTNKAKQFRLDAHFKATIEMLHDYLADPLPEGFAPKVSIIWAGDCVFDGVSLPRFESKPGDAEGIKFLTEKRTDTSAGEWQMLFPGVDIDVQVMNGANHFSMMKEHVPNLTAVLRDALR